MSKGDHQNQVNGQQNV